MSNFIRQNEANMANELLKVQQPLLESSSEMDKLRCAQSRKDRKPGLLAFLDVGFLVKNYKLLTYYNIAVYTRTFYKLGIYQNSYYRATRESSNFL